MNIITNNNNIIIIVQPDAEQQETQTCAGSHPQTHHRLEEKIKLKENKRKGSRHSG